MKIKKHKKQLLSSFILFLVIGLGFIANIVQAAPIISKDTIGKDCYEKGDCSLNNFIGIIQASYTTVFGYIGSIALIMFIISGVMFLISGGNQTRVAKAKKFMISAVIGLLIVFASFLIIDFVLKGIGYENVDTWNTTP
jgi:hypothetical protein